MKTWFPKRIVCMFSVSSWQTRRVLPWTNKCLRRSLLQCLWEPQTNRLLPSTSGTYQYMTLIQPGIWIQPEHRGLLFPKMWRIICDHAFEITTFNKCVDLQFIHLFYFYFTLFFVGICVMCIWYWKGYIWLQLFGNFLYLQIHSISARSGLQLGGKAEGHPHGGDAEGPNGAPQIQVCIQLLCPTPITRWTWIVCM